MTSRKRSIPRPSRRPFITAGLMTALSFRNRVSHEPITAPGGPVVSMTSHGRRVRFAHLAIESIGRGSLRPSRLVLWLDPDDPRAGRPTPALRRLTTRGLEIRNAPDHIGPHTKYYPQVVLAEDSELPLVTADDDMMHPRRWLRTLVDAAAATPGAVVAHRARRVRLTASGRLAPYATWEAAAPTDDDARTIGLGVGGVLYPPSFLPHIRSAGTRFMAVAPRADDIWLHALAVRAGFTVVPVGALSDGDAVPIRWHGSGGLYKDNIGKAANDEQALATYDEEVLVKLRGSHERC